MAEVAQNSSIPLFRNPENLLGKLSDKLRGLDIIGRAKEARLERERHMVDLRRNPLNLLVEKEIAVVRKPFDAGMVPGSSDAAWKKLDFLEKFALSRLSKRSETKAELVLDKRPGHLPHLPSVDRIKFENAQDRKQFYVLWRKFLSPKVKTDDERLQSLWEAYDFWNTKGRWLNDKFVPNGKFRTPSKERRTVMDPRSLLRSLVGIPRHPLGK